MDRYKIMSSLGDGTYGCVFKALSLKTNEIVAIKRMKSKYKSWDECMQLREIKSLRKLSHQNLIKLKEVIKNQDELNLVFEYLELNLYQLYLQYREANQVIPETVIKSIVHQLASGLQYMHKHGFFHRDLKPENIMIQTNPNTYSQHKYIVKICDFGLAREVRSRPPYTDYVSTRWYRAPEILLKSTYYNSPVDIFALACIVAELYLLKPLFPGQNELDQVIKIIKLLGMFQQSGWSEGQKLAQKLGLQLPQSNRQDISSIVTTANEDGISLLTEMLKYDPKIRITAQGILNHNFLRGVTQLNLIATNNNTNNNDMQASFHKKKPSSNNKDKESFTNYNTNNNNTNLPNVSNQKQKNSQYTSQQNPVGMNVHSQQQNNASQMYNQSKLYSQQQQTKVNKYKGIDDDFDIDQFIDDPNKYLPKLSRDKQRSRLDSTNKNKYELMNNQAHLGQPSKYDGGYNQKYESQVQIGNKYDINNKYYSDQNMGSNQNKYNNYQNNNNLSNYENQLKSRNQQMLNKYGNNPQQKLNTNSTNNNNNNVNNYDNKYNFF